jgi:peptidoglycan/xylan/chitin deacetylase (PgdA/CDA1 family)/glycosyltransferase involved in cell wall biosynthesis
MKISVIIPTFNRRAVLEHSLTTIVNQDFPADQYEVVIVVDGSTDGTIDMLRKVRWPCALRVFEQPNRGQSAAQNAGLRAAHGELVLFLDDDDLCPRSLVYEHVSAHSGIEPLIVFGPIKIMSDSLSQLTAELVRKPTEEYYLDLEKTGPQWPLHAYVGPNVSGPRSTFLEAGGFDEELAGDGVSILSDTDLGLRLWKTGIRFHYQASAAVRHFYIKSPSGLVKDAASYGRNEVVLCRKHPEYRPYSGLAKIYQGPWWKRLLRLTEMRFPFSTDPILTVAYMISARLSRFLHFRQMASYLLGRRQAITSLRSSLRAAGSWKTLRAEIGVRLPVLLYHHVGPLRPGTYPSLTISPAHFERQVEWLARHGYVGIRPSDWQAWRTKGTPLPEKPVLFTFDDAYADIARYALPILHRHGFGAAVFVVTGQIGGTNAWDAGHVPGQHPLLSRGEIQKWATQDIEFGAHSRTHADLSMLSEEAVEKEIQGSQQELSQVVGFPITSFAYPYGTYTAISVNCVGRQFDLAFTVDEGLNDLQTNPYKVQRTMVQPSDTWLDLAFRVKLGWSPLQRLRTSLALARKTLCLIQRQAQEKSYIS